jgi:hypothetical protein
MTGIVDNTAEHRFETRPDAIGDVAIDRGPPGAVRR